MWIKHPNGSVRNLESGHMFAVNSERDSRGIETWELVSSPYAAPPVTIATDYADKASASKGLDALLTALDINPVDLVKVLGMDDDNEEEEEK